MYWEIKKLKNGKYILLSTGTKVFRKPVTREQLTEWYVHHAAEAAELEVERLLRSADEKADPNDEEIRKLVQRAGKISSPRPRYVWTKSGMVFPKLKKKKP